MRFLYALGAACFLLLSCALRAQDTVQLGRHRFVPEQNARRALRGTPDWGPATGGQRNVLVQFGRIPTREEVQRLAQQGLTLEDYVGGKAYYALLRDGATNPARMRGASNLSSIVPVRPEWKLSHLLEGDDVPSYAKVDEGVAEVVVRFAGNVEPAQVSASLQKLGATRVRVSSLFRSATVQIPLTQCRRLVELPWVLAVQPVDPPVSLNNAGGRTLSRANLLNSTAPELEGRGLLGQGINVGIWDGNVMWHPDFGQRIHVQEYELNRGEAEQHGTHVAGTVLGSGMVDPDGRGMAPRAQAYTYNFNVQSNGLSAQEEMAQATKNFAITLTQNSYGLSLYRNCQAMRYLSYRQRDYELDRLALLYPQLTHVFAAGNEQQACPAESVEKYGVAGYGSSTWRAKNVIYVGALDEAGRITSFSSFGPQDDGRLFPTVCAKGGEVYSVKPGAQYQKMSGTSMACPTTSGTLALLQERWRQLNRGADIQSDLLRAIVANTADDAGREGPDFQYGYGILNGERAVLTMEKGYYSRGSVAQSATQPMRITVPKGAVAARVMLVWNDPTGAKVHALGESPMVNDLDLSVSVSGKSYLPWVLDPSKGNVEKPAQRAKDVLNNIEQVTLSTTELGAADVLEVSVAASRVAKGEQSYTLVWWFDMPAELRIISPVGGEQFEPGQQFALRAEGVQGACAVEISYDDGKKYTRLGSLSGGNTPRNHSALVRIPVNAAFTGKARFRLVAADGTTATSPLPFTIAPRPERPELETGACGVDGWKLKWTKVNGNIAKYSILLCDPDTESVTSIGEVMANATEFDIPSDKVKGVKSPLFSVAAVLADGTQGKRSMAVQAETSMGKALKVDELPFVESFTRYPSPYFRVKVGKSLRAVYYPASLGTAAGSNSLVFVADEGGGANFDRDDYFSNKNEAHIAQAEMCDLDLTGIPSDQYVYFRVSGLLGVENLSDPTTARFRLLIDGTPTMPLGRKNIEQTVSGHEEEWVYKLDGGKSYKVTMQFVGSSKHDNLFLRAINVEKPSTVRNVSLVMAKPFDDTVDPKDTECHVRVRNKSTETVKDLPLRVYLDDKWIATKMISELGAMSEVELPIVVDISMDDVLGGLRKVRIEADLPDDADRSDNVVEQTLNNRGKVLLMAESRLEADFFGPAPVDPRKTVYIDKPTIFTDCGGYYGNYSAQQVSTLKVLPADSTKRIRVKFLRLEAPEGSGWLGIFTTTVPSSLKLNRLPMRDLLEGTITEARTYVSEAKDGAITFHFRSSRTLAPGWVAEIDFVPAANPLAITAANAKLVGAEEKGEVPVSVTIRNRWQQEQKNVDLYLWDGRKILLEETLPSVPAGETTVTFSKKLEMTRGTLMPQLEVFLECEGDSDGDDNRLSLDAGYDRYCIPGRIAKYEAFAISQVRVENRKVNLVKPRGYAMYTLDSTLVLYKGAGAVSGSVETSAPIADGYGVGMWVDWNDDGLFGDDEKAEVTFEAGKSSFALKLNPPDVQAGRKRARVAIAKADEMSLLPCAEAGLKEGDLHDFMIDLQDGNYPNAGDLELVSVDAGPSGLNLSGSQQVSVLVRNLSNTPYASAVAISYSMDGGQMESEEKDFSADPIAAFGGERTIVLAKTINPSAKGKHVVSVSLSEKPVEVNPKNNKRDAVVWSVVPDADKPLYALHTATQKTKGEYVDLSVVSAKAGELKTGAMRTIEMWVHPDRPQFGTLLAADGLAVYSLYRMADGVPSNAVGVVVGQGMVAFTPENTLPAQRWSHVAVMISEVVPGLINPSCRVQVYINGVKQAVTVRGSAAPSMQKLKLAPKFDGMIDAFRLWDRLRTDAEIKNNMYFYLRESNQSLPAGLVAEFAFDEGAGYGATFSGTDAAPIVVKDESLITKTEGGIWQKITELFAAIRFEHQAAETVLSGKAEYNVLFEGTAPTSVKGTLQGTWPNTMFSYEQKPVDANTLYDFSKDVKLEASSRLFSKTVKQQIVLHAEKDKSNACDIQSMIVLADGTPGLTENITVAPSSSSIVIRPASGLTITDPTKVSLLVVTSSGSELYYKGAKVDTPTKFEVDLHEPVQLLVKAANGRDSRIYTVALALPQTLDWALAKKEYVYGDEPVTVPESSSVGLPISYTSSNPAVASVAGGKLVFAMPGEATITPRQRGGKCYDAAIGSAQKITVKQRTVRLRPAITEATYGEPTPYAFAYETLVNASDERNLPDPMEKAYDLQTPDGKPVQARAILPIGTYHLKAKAPYSANIFYQVEPQDGQFEVKQGSRWAVTFRVKSMDGTELQSANVRIGSGDWVTNAQGQVIVPLPGGQKVAYTVTKEGYALVHGECEVPEDKPLTVDVQLAAASIELTYTAGANGKLAGPTTQKIAPGGDGEYVHAVADEDYVFDKWSDGSMDNPRRDRNVKAALNVEAQFRNRDFRVEYDMTPGGKWLKGDAIQLVRMGGNSTEVMVGAEPNYYFLSWSDGVTDSVRHETDVQEDFYEVAWFNPYATVPSSYDFEEGRLTKGWSYKSEEDAFCPWEVSKKEPIPGYMLDGYFAMANMAVLSNPQENKLTYLMSPRHLLRDVTGDIVMSFDYAYRASGKSKFSVEYSLDGGAWTELSVLADKGRGRSENTVEQSKLTGHKYIEFRWRYEAENGRFALVDNFLVTQKDAPAATLTYVAEPAEGGSFEVDGAPASSQEVASGAKAKPAKAVPAAGYRFVEWVSVGTNPVLTLDEPVFKSQTFTALFRKTELAELSYVANEKTGGLFLIEGVESSAQLVVKGSDAKLVEAKARDGYDFVRWSDDGSANPAKLSTNVQQDAIYEAVFVPKTYKLTFHVMATGNAVEGAKIAVGGKLLTTDAAGQAGLTLAVGKYPYTVTAEGYVAKLAEIEMLNGDRDVTIELSTNTTTVRNGVHFTITANGAPLEQAKVNIDGQDLTSDAAGHVTLSLADGTYPYTVTREGYVAANGSVTVAGAPVQVPVQLEPMMYKVQFAEPAHGMLSVEANGASIASGASVAHGAELKIMTQPEAGYKLQSLLVNGTERMAEVVDNRLVMTVSSDVTIEATFVSGSALFTVTYSQPEHGTLSVKALGEELPSGKSVADGTELTITAKANSGYRLEKLLVNGEDKTAESKDGVLKHVATADVTIAATFASTSSDPTDVQDALLARVVVYPNPFVDEVHIKGLDAAEQLRVIDATGAVVRTFPLVGMSELTLRLGDLPSGVYMLVVDSPSHRKTIRLVRQ